jgi:hypothetical protein
MTTNTEQKPIKECLKNFEPIIIQEPNPSVYLKEENKKPIYTITVLYPDVIKSTGYSTRCVGYKHKLENAKELVFDNYGDIYETNGKHVVIEEVLEGLYNIETEHWFEWIGDYKNGKYIECEKPKHITTCHFSMG